MQPNIVNALGRVKHAKHAGKMGIRPVPSINTMHVSSYSLENRLTTISDSAHCDLNPVFTQD